MKIDKTEIKRILLITLTNIGDIILTTPVINVLDKEFPDARVDVMVGPSGRDIFLNDPRVFKVIVYHKRDQFAKKQRLISWLRRAKYDLVVDLKNTLFGILIGSRYRTSVIQTVPREIVHKKDFHLWKLKSLGVDVSGAQFYIHITKHDEDYINVLLENVPDRGKLIVVSPAAKSLIKRWGKEGFARVCDMMTRDLGASLVMVGDESDKGYIDEIIGAMEARPRPFNLAGLTTIPQLAQLLKMARGVLTLDSAPMHVASAVGAGIVSIFGPTDPGKYGPLGKKDRVVRKELPCSPCEMAQCRLHHECMGLISADEVFAVVKEVLQ